MRIIAGSARGRRLITFKGNSVRPTPDRVREALFSILQSRLGGFHNVQVLDLFAGSGALAIEALSRGASRACLIEKSSKSAEIIRQNLKLCRLDDRARLWNRDAFNCWSQLEEQAPFNLIFLDPPYRQELANRALNEIAQRDLLAAQGLVCIETAAEEELPAAVSQLERVFQRRYGTIMIDLYSYQGT